MTFLLLTIFCSVSMALLLKASENAGNNSVAVIGINYLAGSIVGLGLIALDGGSAISHSTLFFGVMGGFIWPIPFFILTRTIRALGIAIAAPLARFGLIIPVLFGLLFLGEGLSTAGTVGLVAAFAAILLISPFEFGSVQSLDKSAMWLIPAMIVMIGMANLWVNLFNVRGVSAETKLFFTLLYIVATAFTFIVMALRRIRPTRREIQYGVPIGIVNFCYTFFLLGALRSPLFVNNSAIVYTVTNVAYMLLVFTAGALIWHERVTRKNVVGVGVAALALVLLNVR